MAKLSFLLRLTLGSRNPAPPYCNKCLFLLPFPPRAVGKGCFPSYTASCPDGMVRCDEGKCIPESLVCDGEADCRDGTDEPATCGEDPTTGLHVGVGRIRVSQPVPLLPWGPALSENAWTKLLHQLSFSDGSPTFYKFQALALVS